MDTIGRRGRARRGSAVALAVACLAGGLLVAGPVAARTAQTAPPTDRALARTQLEPPADAGDAPDGIRQADDPVAGQYIVRLDHVAANGVDRTAGALAKDYGGEVLETYDQTVPGFAVSLTKAQAEALAADPQVASVAENNTVRLASGGWGQDRIDQRDLPLNGAFTTDATGAGVDIYIIDSGIRTSHQEFGGRATIGIDTLGGNGQDCNGHGTHVASLAGGATYGVAPQANLIAVRAFSCGGSSTTAQILAGIDWVVANADGPSVVNMSFHDGPTAYEGVISAAEGTGITFVGAAGNGDFEGTPQDACGFFPSSEEEVITVGATTITDAQASFSNTGPCVDILAPGVDIPGAGIGSDSDTATFTGTSMSTPAVAGAVALFLQSAPEAPVEVVRNAIVGDATPGRISGTGGDVNLLLYTGELGHGASLTVVQEAAGSQTDFSFTCTGTPSCRDFALDDDPADPTLPSGTTLRRLAPGTYTVTQGPAANWTPAGLTCTGGAVADTANRRVTFTVTAEEHALCTFTDASATITTVQDTAMHYELVTFGYERCAGSTCDHITLDDNDGYDATYARSGTLGGLVPGTYTVTQDVVAGFQLDAIACNGSATTDVGARRATITITGDEQVSCTFTNRRIPPANDHFADATIMSGATPAVSNLLGGTLEPGEPILDGYGTLSEYLSTVWFRWTAPTTGPATLQTCGFGAAIPLAIFTGGSLAALTPVPAALQRCTDGIQYTIAAVAGVTYSVQFTEWNQDRPLQLETPPGYLVVPPDLTGARAGSPFGASLSASGGTGPYAFATVAGSLPAGLVLDPNGVLHGTPAAAGTSSFTVRATDHNGLTTDRPLTMAVAPALPVLKPGVGAVYEGDTGDVTVDVPITLLTPSAVPVTVDYQTFDNHAAGVATPGVDYVATSGSLTFAPGETSKVVTLAVHGDTMYEPPLVYGEWAFVSFSGATNATIDASLFGLGIGVIGDDDPRPTIKPGNMGVLEGNSGTTVVQVPVTLTNPSQLPITVNYQTYDNHGVAVATPGLDYVATSGTVTFAPGETSKTVPVTVIGDTIDEPPLVYGEWILVSFSGATNATIEPSFFGLGLGIIFDDD